MNNNQNPSNTLSSDEITDTLKTDILGKRLEVYDVCDSTNTIVTIAAGNGAPEGLVVVADRQTMGRGRRGRSWQSPPGVSISMSMLLRPDISPESAPQITPIAALAVAAAIDELICEKSLPGKTISKDENNQADKPILIDENNQADKLLLIDENNQAGKLLLIDENNPVETINPAKENRSSSDNAISDAKNMLRNCQTAIKWPNDVLLGQKKVCGILTELSCSREHIDHIVVGIGINVTNTVFSPDLADKAGSIYSVTGICTDRNRLVAGVCNFFEEYYRIFLQTGSFSGLVKIYEKKLVNLGREVRVLDPKGEFTGIAKGITKEGHLVVETADAQKVISSGEVSVRGIYGYV